MKQLLIAACIVGLFSACGEQADRALVGRWQAVEVLEAGDSLRLDPAEVTFDFQPDNRYVFNSTLRYTEAGKWRYENGHLFANDTTRNDTPERIVAVDKLTTDSLVLRMLAEGKERELTLLRR